MTQLNTLIDDFKLNEGNATKDYKIAKETVYENLMVLKVMFTSIQVRIHSDNQELLITHDEL